MSNQGLKENRGPFKVRAKPYCPVCGAKGYNLHQSVEDLLFHTQGYWDLSRCENQSCRTIWLNPFPEPEEVPRFYSTYYTHDQPIMQPEGGRLEKQNDTGAGAAFTRTLLSKFFFWRSVQFCPDLFYLGHITPGSLLDIGCGNGQFLDEARKRGWQVRGCEFDANAAKAAHEIFDVTVDIGDLSKVGYPHESFDAVTANNVIEHLPDARLAFKEVYRILSKGGVFVSVSPNPDSFLHKKYGRDWRGLEVPRHLILYAPYTLRKLALESGFAGAVAFSSSGNIDFVDSTSQAIHAKREQNFSSLSKPTSRLMKLSLKIASYLGSDLGEWSVIVAKK